MDQNEKETIATDIKEKSYQINDNEGLLICGFVWKPVIKEKTRQINAMNDI